MDAMGRVRRALERLRARGLPDRPFWETVIEGELEHRAGDEPWQCALCGVIQWSMGCPGVCLSCGAIMSDWYAPEDLEEGVPG